MARQLVKEIRTFGCHGRVGIKTDGDHVITSLARDVARERGDLPTVLEHPPPSDSKAKGYAERGVRSVEEQVRALKTAFQSSIRVILDVQSFRFAWFVEHAADTLNKGLVGQDGCTPYERVRGRRYGGLLYEFGQVVLSKIPGKPEGGVIAPRWIKGIWLGNVWGTDDYCDRARRRGC